MAGLLLRKAAQDEFILHKIIPDPDSPDEMIGFHAQQAVEKMLKAVLTSVAVRYPRSHDLVELLELVHDSGLQFPIEVKDVECLNPYAVGLRYTESLSVIDRSWASDCVARVRRWAESILSSEPP